VTERGEDKEAHEHPERSVDQRWPSTVFLDDVETREGHAEVHSTEDDRCNIWVGDTDGVEDRSTIVEVVAFSR
jgi:hypothetical protein